MVTLDLEAMARDPFPTFAALRAADQWTWSDLMQTWIVSKYADVVHIDENPEVFSAEVPNALLTKTIGLTMIRLEGPAHRRVRGASDRPLKRSAIERRWQARLDNLAERYLDPLRASGSADLVSEFASPFTGACLREVLGLFDATPEDIGRWSDAYIAGLINNAGDPDIAKEAEVACDEARDCVASALRRVRTEPDATVISAMADDSGSGPLTLDEIASNVRLMIAGGFNDARDAIAILPWLLLTNPRIKDRALSDAADFDRAIDESVRWLSPVGSYPRVLVQDYTSPAAQLKKGERVLVLAASANWDETVFADPGRFDIDRPNLDRHLGFSVGAHYCLGSHLVRAMLRSSVPQILNLPEIIPVEEPMIVGWQFRGPRSVRVAFSPAASK